MDNERSSRRVESVYSSKVKAGRRRTYFFDVRQTKGEDFYITLTESTKRFNGDGYERHKIFLYKEDFNRFAEGLNDAINHVKEVLLPEYDYDEYTRRHLEYEKQKEEEAKNALAEGNDTAADPVVTEEPESKDSKLETVDDMTW